MGSSRRFAWCVLMVGVWGIRELRGQGSTPLLRLKTAGVETDMTGAPSSTGQAANEQAWSPRHWGGRDWHWLVEFAALPAGTQREELVRRGARILEFVPDTGLMVAAAEDADFSGLNVVRAAHLRPEQKMSPAIAPGRAWFLVEFQGDVDGAVARSIILAEDLSVRENPDLLPGQLLVEGTDEDMLRLAGWDEVEYLFPAAPELVAGGRLEACPNALTAQGRIGQITAVSGDGWDGPGKKGADLTYFFDALTQKMPAETVQTEVQRAMAEWSRVVLVNFTKGTKVDQPRQVDVLFARGEHGDGYPFDGPGKVLAHAFYPAPPNPETIAGDLHLDDDENWQQGGTLDLYSVVLHELGHTLGLGHSDNVTAVMYPYYKKVTALAQEDIDTIRQLYAARESVPAAPSPLVVKIIAPPGTAAATLSLSGTVEGGKGAVNVSWWSDRGGSGDASGGRSWTVAVVAVELGRNTITVRAVDEAGKVATASVAIERLAPGSPAPVTLRIQTPLAAGTVQTSRPTIELTGVASHPSGIARVSWAATGGANGPAIGTATWSTGSISLIPGFNRILVTASDNTGQYATVFLDVNYQPTVEDTTPPSVAILYPDTANFLTTEPEITLAGSAYDNVEVKQVTWATSSGRSGNATGTTHWTAGPIALPVGTTAIVIRAIDGAGNAGWQSVVVTRR